tara:strand:+ start:629 stop:946 length:318 start_codon:yes stop_codon:yes gene_type:complete
MVKKILSLISLIFFTISCGGDTIGSVKRGLTGQKQTSTDEFLVEKKDPLVLPPDYENLPTPSEKEEATEEMINLRKSLEIASDNTESFSGSGSTEESILQKIKNK